MNEENRGKWLILPYFLIAVVAAARLAMILPFNFVPVLSCLLFFGAKRPSRESVLPLAVLIGVDVFLTRIRYGYPLSIDHVVTWLWYAAAIMLGATVLRRSFTMPRALTSVLSASVSFFVISNLTVWAAWSMYPKTWSGLSNCFIAALPFFRNSLVSETLATGMIFVAVRLSEVWKEIAFTKRTFMASMLSKVN
jgi:hypothetical protein